MPQVWEQTAGKTDFNLSGKNVEEKLKLFGGYYLAPGQKLFGVGEAGMDETAGLLSWC